MTLHLSIPVLKIARCLIMNIADTGILKELQLCVLELMNSDLPVVTIDYVHHNCTAVSSNNIQGMEDLVKYIYGQGHRKIAYIHGQQVSYVTKDRLASFYRTVDELGLKIRMNISGQQIIWKPGKQQSRQRNCSI